MKIHLKLNALESDPAGFQTHARFHGCPRYLQEQRRTTQNEGTGVVTRFSPL